MRLSGFPGTIKSIVFCFFVLFFFQPAANAADGFCLTNYGGCLHYTALNYSNTGMSTDISTPGAPDCSYSWSGGVKGYLSHCTAPACPSGEVRNSLTGLCELPPSDCDNDGTPDDQDTDNSSCGADKTCSYGQVKNLLTNECVCPDIPEFQQVGACANPPVPEVPNTNSDPCEDDFIACGLSCGDNSKIDSFACASTDGVVDSTSCTCAPDPDNSECPANQTPIYGADGSVLLCFSENIRSDSHDGGCSYNSTYGTFNGQTGCWMTDNSGGHGCDQGNCLDGDNLIDSSGQPSETDGYCNDSNNNTLCGGSTGPTPSTDPDPTTEPDPNLGTGTANGTTSGTATTTETTTNPDGSTTTTTSTTTTSETTTTELDIDFSGIENKISGTNSRLDTVISGQATTNSSLADLNAEFQFTQEQLAAVNEGLNTSNGYLQDLNDGQGSLLAGVSTLNDTAIELGTGISDVVDGVSTLGDVIQQGNDDSIAIMNDIDDKAQETNDTLALIEQNTGQTVTALDTLETGLNSRLDAANTNLENINDNLPSEITTDTAIGETTAAESLTELGTSLTDISTALDQGNADSMAQLDVKAGVLQQSVTEIKEYFMPQISTSGGCDLGQVNIFGSMTTLSLCPYMDLFILIGNVLFFFANYRAVFILFNWVGK